MSDIKSSIDPGNQPSKDWLAVQRTQQLGADKGEIEKLAKKNPRSLLMAGLCAYIKRTALFLASRPLAGRKNVIAGELEIELAELKKALETLTQKDQSRDPDYAQHLSQVWLQFFESVNLAVFLERKKSNSLIQLKTLIETFLHYPPNQEHSLGYYMTEAAGKEWLPFPFMEQLHLLYEDHQTNPQKSQLSQWIDSIDLILSNLLKK